MFPNRERIVTVSAVISGAPLGDVVAAGNKVIDKMDLPGEVTIQISGSYEDQQDYCGNGHDTFAVFTFDGRRRETFDYLSDVFHTNGLSLRIVNEDIFETFQTCTEFGRITHLDIIFISVFTIFRRYRTIDTVTQVVTGS